MKEAVVVITGASAGVGRARVREFAKRGSNIGLIARDQHSLEAAKHEVENCGGKALVFRLTFPMRRRWRMPRSGLKMSDTNKAVKFLGKNTKWRNKMHLTF